MNGTVRVLFKTRLIFPRINGPTEINTRGIFWTRRFYGYQSRDSLATD